MSTAAVFATGTTERWGGAFICASDGYPTGIGPQLWKELKAVRNHQHELIAWCNQLGSRVTYNNAGKLFYSYVYVVDPSEHLVHILLNTGARKFSHMLAIPLMQKHKPDWEAIEAHINTLRSMALADDPNSRAYKLRVRARKQLDTATKHAPRTHTRKRKMHYHQIKMFAYCGPQPKEYHTKILANVTCGHCLRRLRALGKA